MKKFQNSTYPAGGILLIALAIIILLADIDKVTEFPKGDSVYRAAFLVVACFVAWRAMIRSAVFADPKGIIVKNPLKTHRIQWSDIDELRTEDRLVIRLRDGREIRCWAVQRANAARMLKVRSYADEVAEDLRKMLDEAT